MDVEVEAAVDIVDLGRAILARRGCLDAVDVYAAHDDSEVKLLRVHQVRLLVVGSDILLASAAARVDVAHDWVVGIERSPSYVNLPQRSVTSWMTEICSPLVGGL